MPEKPKKRGNIQNLIQYQNRTPEERRENARKAGIASGEARRERKTLREELVLLLSTGQYQSKMCTKLVKKAMKGDIAAFTTIRDTIGEKPVDKVSTDFKLEDLL